MSSVGFYAGSFNPWHDGHQDILEKALHVFDNIVVCTMINPDKGIESAPAPSPLYAIPTDRVSFETFDGFLVDAVKKFNATAVIRGLRNGHDLQ